MCALGLGAILLRSAILHIENSYTFLQSVYAYDLLPPLGGLTLAAILPYIQLVLALCFFCFRSHWNAAFTYSAVLFSLLSIVQVVTLARGLNISCGCFGDGQDDPIGISSISLAVACMGISIAGLILARPDSRSPDAIPE